MGDKIRAAYRSIFAPCADEERAANLEGYWASLPGRSGELLEAEQDLTMKRERLAGFKANPVRSAKPLPDPAAFHRNCRAITDDPAKLDAKTLLLANIYRFAYHERAAVDIGWEATIPLAQARRLEDKIDRCHIAEEICHGRLFMEMFRTFHLEGLDWPPVDPATRRAYRVITRLPSLLLAQPAFISELLGFVFYRFVDSLLDDCLGDEPEARGRIRELLHDIMADEVSHIGLRRNYLGPLAIALTPRLMGPICGWFFGEMLGNMPPGRRPMNNALMVEEALRFDYSGIPAEVMERAWVPAPWRAGSKT